MPRRSIPSSSRARRPRHGKRRRSAESAVKVFGLTGGIGSGKSTVSAMLRDLGAPIIDADLLAREVVEPGTPGLAEVAARFPGVLTPQGTLDRAALGARVFQNAD